MARFEGQTMVDMDARSGAGRAGAERSGRFDGVVGVGRIVRRARAVRRDDIDPPMALSGVRRHVRFIAPVGLGVGVGGEGR